MGRPLSWLFFLKGETLEGGLKVSWLIQPRQSSLGGRGQEGKRSSAAHEVFSAREQIRLKISGIFLILKPAMHRQEGLGREEAGCVVVKDSQ